MDDETKKIDAQEYAETSETASYADDGCAPDDYAVDWEPIEPDDGTMVMNPSLLKKALAASREEDEDGSGGLRMARARKDRASKHGAPVAFIKLADDGKAAGSEAAKSATPSDGAPLQAALAPDVTTMLHPGAAETTRIAASSESAADVIPTAMRTMVMPAGIGSAVDAARPSERDAEGEGSRDAAMAGGAEPSPGTLAPDNASGAEQSPSAPSFPSEGGLPAGVAAIAGTSALLDRAETPVASALFLSAFFDELYRMGVRDVVVSPGSRSTPLAMVAYEMSLRDEYDVRLVVDVDERGAAFFALGVGKATGRPACVVCTSGTAGANYYPAVLEAESSRVPLLVLTGDRPPRLQGLGAPQTCNQEKLYGDHVRSFANMPLPAADDASIAFARQSAREAWAAAIGPAGRCTGGPVHLNFPFEEPLKPDLAAPDLFAIGRSVWCGAPEDAGISSVGACVNARGRLSFEAIATIEALFAEHRSVIMAGEGACETDEDVEALLTLARQRSMPVLADPLSNLRKSDDCMIIEHYDNIFGKPGCPEVDLVVRFGRYPVSKRACEAVREGRPLQIVVDQLETRDFNAGTDLFVRMAPGDFVRDLNEAAERNGDVVLKDREQERLAEEWTRRNDAERARVSRVVEEEAGFEGAYVRAVLESLPEGSLLFSANSMSIRAVDTFCDRGIAFDILCNRGLNGIDGTLSTALGAAQRYRQTAFLTGDLALLHDVSAFALNRELLKVHAAAGEAAPSVVVVLLNNHGGGIFDMLPQKSDDPYFERLFLTPEYVDFGSVAAGFDIPHVRVTNVKDLKTAFAAFVGRPGMCLIEAEVPLTGLKERYAPYR